MSGRLERGRLTPLELRVLSGLCAVADEGKPIVGAVVVERLQMDTGSVYRAIKGLSEKGWVAGGPKVGSRSPLKIVTRPAGIRNRYAYTQTLATFTNRARGDVPKVRYCMTCGVPFQSGGWNNRQCDRCRKGPSC